MPKRIALYDYIEVDGEDLSNFARALTFSSEDEQVDVSGFNAGGDSEFLQGTRVRQVEVEFGVGRGTDEVHQTIYPIHNTRGTCDFVWRANVNDAVGPTNQELRGTVRIPTYSEGGTRGEYEVTTITFIEADANDPLEFYST